MFCDMYKNYLLEYQKQSVYETHFGFLTFRIINKTLFLLDIYVSPEYRLTGKSKDLILNLMSTCRNELDIDNVVGQICVRHPKWNVSKKMLRSLGFKYKSNNKNEKMIYFHRSL